MRLADVAMIAADTSRSKAYLQAMARNEILPNYVLVLANKGNSALPGQHPAYSPSKAATSHDDPSGCWSEAQFDLAESIEETLAVNHVPYDCISGAGINDSPVVEMIRRRVESVFVYSGYGGVLLRKEVLGCGKRFLHVHGGYLPGYKGSTANYFSMIAEDTMGASALFLTEAIDSGPILRRRKFPPPQRREAIDHVFDPAARAKVLVETLQEYVRHGFKALTPESNEEGETYYVIHPVLKHIAILGDPGNSPCA